LESIGEEICEKIFVISRVQNVRRQVTNFAQGEEEGIDQPWDNGLIKQGPRLGFSGDVLLHTFYFSLTPSACGMFRCVQVEISWREHSRRPPITTKIKRGVAMQRTQEEHISGSVRPDTCVEVLA
jgi:hypothetical protein